MKNLILRWAARYAEAKSLPDSVPTSGPAALKNDFIEMYLGDDFVPMRFRVEQVVESGLGGYWYENYGEGGFPASVPNVYLSQYHLTFRHFYKGYTFKYSSPGKFVLHQLLCLPYFQIWRERAEQSFFNRRRFATKDRIEVLRFFLGQSLEERVPHTDRHALLDKLISPRWVNHPKQLELYRYYGLLLDSLVNSRDLEKRGNSYVITGEALTTLFNHEESERRHNDNVRQQRALKTLTGVLAVLGAIQIIVQWLH